MLEIREFELQKHRVGWKCTVYIRLTHVTDRFFPAYFVYGYGRWPWTAIWNGWRVAKRTMKKLRAESKLTKILDC